MKNKDGITLVALVLAIIVIGVTIFTGVQYTKNYINNQKIEDTKATMLAIQGIITNISNKHTVDAENNILIGTKLEIENNTTEYIITEELKNALLSIENSNFYILSQEELNNEGIKDVSINNNEFYVVDYNSGEVFYSLGINGKYKLSEIQ